MTGRERGQVKCLIWDLDNTLWDGILLEEVRVNVRPETAEVVRVLDERGILQSVASRNDPAAAMAELERTGLAEYFLYPQIGWNPKSASIKAIADSLNLGLDAMAFVDDQEFEREEVGFAHPQVLCLDAADISRLPDRAEFTPRFATEDARQRRAMYQSATRREMAEEEFTGTGADFLATLGMVFRIAQATEDDLQRAEELTVRTNQLNSTGFTYSHAELAEFVRSPDHLLLVAELEDRFGSYGKIGLALVDRQTETWRLKLLLMSCRVMSRGVGTVLLNHVMSLARGYGARLQADFRPTDRNRVMYVTYRFAGFREVESAADSMTLEANLDAVHPPPPHLTLKIG